ncbi:MAG: DoxX family membrane protein, partial [Ferrovibrio sp.]
MFLDTAIRLSDLWDTVDKRFGPVVDLCIRLLLAQGFFVSGLIKVTSWQAALFLAANEYPVPWLDAHSAAILGATVELAGSVLLAVGLFARPAALALAVLSLVIQVYYKELPEHLFWAILLGWIVVRGAGALSVDALVAPQIRRLPLPGSVILHQLLGLSNRFAAAPYLLFIRLWMAEIFWNSGLTKIASWDTTVLLFAEEYKVPLLPPELAAVLGTATELSMPVLLALGLCTRVAALPLMAMTLVIQFTYLDKAEHWLWLLSLAVLATRGGGFLSLDAAIRILLGRWFPVLDGRPAADPETAPKVVIIGGGFAGLSAARALRHAPAAVTLVDRRNYHLFQPLLYQVATACLSPADIATPIREILRDQPNTNVLLGRVGRIDTGARLVHTDTAAVPYDYLVVATGARHGYFGHDEWEAAAPGLKKIDDATAIRARILQAFERAEACEDPIERSRLLTFVLVGAGPTGVELAGAIAELARFGMDRDFRRIDPAAARVILIQAADRLSRRHPSATR